MAASRMVTAIGLVCLVATPVFGDTIILSNGAELRNVKIVEEGEHTIKINVIEYTNIIVGKSKVASVQRDEDRAAVEAPDVGEPALAVPQEIVPRADREVASRTVYKLPTSEEDKLATGSVWWAVMLP